MITVLMPVYIKNPETLFLTMEAIESLGEVFLIIVDNNSDLFCRDTLMEKADLYIRNKENKGYAFAVNQGLKLTKTDLVAVANNDIRVSPNWQEVAREVLREDDVYSCHLRMTDYDVPFQYGKQTAYTGKERWCGGSFFILNIKRGFLTYDENFFNSYDDWDYFLRVRKAGRKTAYTDKACYQHEHSFTQAQIPERRVNDLKNKEYFKRKHGKYAEDLFAEEFPEQMKIDYWKGFEIGGESNDK